MVAESLEVGACRLSWPSWSRRIETGRAPCDVFIQRRMPPRIERCSEFVGECGEDDFGELDRSTGGASDSFNVGIGSSGAVRAKCTAVILNA